MKFSKNKLVIVFLIFSIFINGCIQSHTVKEIPQETNFKPVVYFCPEDNCEGVLAGFIGSAKKYVHCALFDLDLESVVRVLGEKSKEIDVKIVVDNDNYGVLKGPGVRQDNSNQLTHNKFCIIDGEKISSGSFNPTDRGANYNNNNFVVFYSKYLAYNYEKEFMELWNGTFGDGDKVDYPIIYLNNNKIENYFCPEDECKDRVIGALKKAEKSIYFMTFSFTDEDTADILLFKENVDVKGVFEKVQAGSKYSQYQRLKDFGLDVKLDNNKYNMHHKVFIIDNSTVITGSYNPTGSGNYRNDENILIIYDEEIAMKFLEEFEKIWV